MRDDVSRRGLWQYNIDYMKGYGAKQAGLDIFRIFIQEITNDELNYDYVEISAGSSTGHIGENYEVGELIEYLQWLEKVNQLVPGHM